MNAWASVRSVWRDKTFAVTTLVLLSVGISACTAIFSIVNTVLIRPVPYERPDRIVTVWTLHQQSGRNGTVSAPDFADFKQQSHSFQRMSFYQLDMTNVFANGGAERDVVALVGAGFANVLGVRPVLGRDMTDEEATTPGRDVALVSHSFWQRRFGGSAQAVGQTVRLENRNYEIIGVLPPGFHYPDRAANADGATDVWVPAAAFMMGATSRTAHNYRVLARLREGVSVQAANAEMKTIADRLARQYPENVNKSASVILLQDYLVRNVRKTLQLLLGSVFVLLAIACANLANLLLARMMNRRRELAVRAALGASRWQILQQLLAESFAIAVPAAVVGLFVGSWAAKIAVRFAPADLPRGGDVGLDWTVAIFAVGVALTSSIVFTVIPGLHASRSTVSDALHLGGGHSVSGGGSRRLRTALVTAEIGGSLSLVIAAVLLIRSLSALLGTDPGYNPNGVLAASITIPAANASDELRASALFTNLLERVRNSPEIESASATNTMPNSSSSDGLYTIEGRPALAPKDWGTQQAGFIVIAPGYFHLLDIGTKEGRDFDARDSQQGQLTCIVNEALARQSFPDGNAIGHRIHTGMDTVEGYMTIVGVVADVRQYGLDREPQAIIYMPYPQHPSRAPNLALLARVRGTPGAASSTIQRMVHELDPELAVEFAPLTQFSESSAAAPRYRTTLFSIFAGIALLLAAVGLYSLMSYSVVQRRREMGVRMALGAGRSDVLMLVLREGGRLTAIGIGVGIPLAIITAKLLSSFIYGITWKDPVTMACAACVLAVAGIVAVYPPAYRATRVELAEVLRHE